MTKRVERVEYEVTEINPRLVSWEPLAHPMKFYVERGELRRIIQKNTPPKDKKHGD